jgi:Sec-independent protein translocase protein TatA
MRIAPFPATQSKTQVRRVYFKHGVFMGFYGLNLISFLIIFLIALLLFGPRYLHIILKDLYISVGNYIKILLKLYNTKLNDNKSESETDITSG